MQPYTHPLMGALAGIVFFPDNMWAQGACIIGSGLPDVPIALQVVVDKLKKRPLFSNEQEGSFWFLTKELSHSPLLWIGCIAAGLTVSGFFAMLSLAFGIGVMSHCLIDMLTHCGMDFRATDQSLAWPFYQMGLVPKLGGVFGIWDYRRNPPTLKPKFIEVMFILFTFIAGLLIQTDSTHDKLLWRIALVVIGACVAFSSGLLILVGKDLWQNGPLKSENSKNP